MVNFSILKVGKIRQVLYLAKVNVGVKIEQEMRDKFELIADQQSLSYADLIRVALHDYLRRYEKENGRIDPAEINQMKLINDKSK